MIPSERGMLWLFEEGTNLLSNIRDFDASEMAELLKSRDPGMSRLNRRTAMRQTSKVIPEMEIAVLSGTGTGAKPIKTIR